MVGLAKRRAMGASGSLLLLMALVMMLAAPALATHVDPIFIAGNQNCNAATGLVELTKFEPVSSGSQAGVTITVNGDTFDWTSTVDIAAVFVKGGSDGNLYLYPGGATADTGLHAPVNPANDQFFGLSHITFCVPAVTTTTEDTTTTTVEDTTTTTAEETTTTTADVGGTTTTTAQETTTTTAQVGGIVVTLPSAAQVSNTTASTLPFTGMSTGSVAVIGAALTAMGALLLVASRRGEDKSAVRSWS
jgi:hypothetical protein